MAKVTDTGGSNPKIENVFLFYKRSKDSKWNKENMYSQRNDDYKAILRGKALDAEGTLEFYIEAVDTPGLSTKSKVYKIKVEGFIVSPM